MAYAGWTGLGLTVLVMALLGLPLILIPDLIASTFSTDLNLISAAAPMIAFLFFVLIADGSQTVMAHALRGRSETWVPAVLHFVSYLVIMIPSGWLGLTLVGTVLVALPTGMAFGLTGVRRFQGAGSSACWPESPPSNPLISAHK